MIERRGKLSSNNIIREHAFPALHKEQEQMSEQPISKEEAERLANEFMRRPVSQFYDEHYRMDNPAMRRIVTNPDEFAAMLQRRGHALLVEDDYYIVTIGNERITVAEAFFKWQLVAEVARQLDYLVGQHHVQCGQCGEPLLFSAKYVDEDQQALKWYGCRSPKAGPHSEILERCPGCGIEFDYPPPMKEIADV